MSVVWGLLLILFSLTVSAQTVTEGAVTDETGKGLSFVNVAVLSVDSVYLSGTTTDENGHFVLTLTKGNLLRATCVGYKTCFLVYTDQPSLSITLMTESHELNEVTVKSHFPQTQFKGEGMITTVEGSILSRMPAIDLMLDRIPGLMARNGSVSVLGRGSPLIYINGRIMQDGSELERLRPEEIKTVEVIPNPGARYPASVSCVLRIVTKKPVGEGLSGSTITNGVIDEYKRTSGSENLFLNFRSGGLDVSGTFAGCYTHSPDNKQTTETSFLEDIWRKSSRITQEYNNVQAYARLGVNYIFSPDQTVGASVSYNRTARNRASGNSELTLWCNDQLSETEKSDYLFFSHGSSVSANTYYMGKIGKMNIDFNADYYWGNNDNENTTNEQLLEQSSQTVKTIKETQNRLFASRLVLSRPLFIGNFLVGGEYSFSKRNSLYNILPKDLLDDEDSHIRENMYSAFIEYAFSIKKLYVQAGLRYECLNFKYYDHGVFMDAQSKTYGDWFPSLALSMPAGKIQMQLTFSSGISRPSYNSLREGIQYDNQYTYETGNPFLLPTTTRNTTYSITWRWLYASVAYSHVSNQYANKHLQWQSENVADASGKPSQLRSNIRGSFV